MNPENNHLDHRLESWASGLPAPSVSLEASLEASIRRDLAASLTPVKPIASPSRLTVTFFGVFLLAAVILITVLDKAGFHLMTHTQISTMGAILSTGAILFSFSLASRIIPASRGLPLAALLLLTGAALLGALALLFPWRTHAPFVVEGLPCAILVLAVAAPSALLFYLLARRGALFFGASLGAVIGALAATLALTAAQFQCMFPQAPHLLLFHGGIAALFIGASALFGALMQRRAR